MIVETKVLGQPVELADRDIPLPAGTQSLRGLLTELVRVEVEQYEQRRRDQLVLRILSPADLANGSSAGRIVSAPRDVPGAPTVDEATTRALEAFGDGLYLAILDGKQVEELDAPIEVMSDSRLRLVRLVALAGG